MLCGPQAEGICGGCHAGLLSPIEAHFIQRQLKLYGSKGPDGGGYHELFLRHKLFLCGTIRFRVKGTGVKGATSPETEPNFYSMPFMKANDASTTLKRDPEGKVALKMEEECECSDPA